jgi:hypothetical protein
MEFFSTIPINSSSPIMLNTLMLCPAMRRVKTARGMVKGRIVIIVTGSI